MGHGAMAGRHRGMRARNHRKICNNLYSLFIRFLGKLCFAMSECLPPFHEGQFPTVEWLFLDLNSYFASVEQEHQPALRGRPVGVVAVDTESTCCLAASYEAKAYGVKTGTSVKDAEVKVPSYHHRGRETKVVCGVSGENYCRHRRASTPHTVCSVDEMACKLMGRERFLPNATTLAYRIKQSIRNFGLALSCSIGLAPNSYLAKTAADLCKPDGLTILLKKDLPYALHCMELRDVVGISHAMEQRLHSRNITTVEQLCRFTSQQMRNVWGSVQGETMWYSLQRRRLEGETERIAKKRREAARSGAEISHPDKAYLVGLKLLTNAAARLRRLNMWARGIGVTVAFPHLFREIPNGDEPSGWNAHRNISNRRDTITLQDHFRELWQDCPRTLRCM